jgi:hypothetical protein
MTDDPFYRPGHRSAPPVPRPAERMWEVTRADGVSFACDLRYHGEFGVEAQILRDAELLIGRRFATRAEAVAWAETERAIVVTVDAQV